MEYPEVRPDYSIHIPVHHNHEGFRIIRLSKEGHSQTITRLVIYVAMMRFEFFTVLLPSGSVTSGI